MKIIGVILEIGDIQIVNDKFKKRKLVVNIGSDSGISNPILFELHMDKVDWLDSYSVNNRVCVDFVLKGRQHNDKFFNCLVINDVNLEK